MIDFSLTPQDFRARYFEREPLPFRNALPDRPFAWSDLDAWLHVVEPSAPAVQLFQRGPIPEHGYTEEVVELGRPRRRLNKTRFYGYMASGATLVINRLERYCVAAQRLCTAIGRFAGAQTTGNAYVSFSGDGTFGKHWDTHDVFAIQLIGRKRWRVFPPTLPLPLPHQTSDRSGHECPAEAALECTLEAGDVLYVPRGWWHHVLPLDVGSLHLSVGSYAPTLYDYVMWTSARYLDRQVGARCAFSAADRRAALADVVRELPALLLDPRHAAEFERDLIGRQRLNAEFNLGLQLDAAAAPLSDAAELSLTTFHAPELERRDFAVNGVQLRLDAVSQAVVAALRDCLSLRFDVLRARLLNVPPDALRRAVLDLARHDLLTIRA